MKITSKGQVTIPQAVRAKAGLHPHSEVEFEVRDNGEVILRAVTAPASSANALQFKDMGTDEFMAFLRA